MSTTTMAGQEIEEDAEGSMLNPDQWSPEIAAELARGAGIDPLTDKHWQVVDFCRRDAADKVEAKPEGPPRQNAGVSMKEMYQLFPKGPGILSAKISGLTKPKGCI